MSFSAQIKEELFKHYSTARHCQMAELAALLHCCGQYGMDSEGGLTVGFQTENALVVKKGFTLLKKTYNIDTGVPVGAEDAEKIVRKFGELSGQADSLLVKNSCCRRAYLRGAFLGCGSMSDPKKSYHMEFVLNYPEQAEQIREIIGDFGIEAKIVRRKKYYVVYVKEGSAIVDLLNVMEAHVSLMEFENQRILKEMRNSINRQVNCEAANIQKTVKAATRQVDDIQYIKEHYGFSNLPDSLREMAEVRLEYPDASLKELGEYLDPPVGKSGVNHRLMKLCELAEKLRI